MEEGKIRLTLKHLELHGLSYMHVGSRDGKVAMVLFCFALIYTFKRKIMEN